MTEGGARVQPHCCPIARGQGSRTLTASWRSPHRLPVDSTWYVTRFGAGGCDDDGESGDEEEESEGCEDMVR